MQQRKPKERDLPQPTDLDEKLIAFRRRTAGATRPKEKAERVQAVVTDKPPKPLSPRKAHASPQILLSRPAAAHEADPEDFSRRLKISSSPSPRPSQPPQKQSGSKLFNPNRDPIPTLRRTAEPDAMSDAASSSYVSRGAAVGAQRETNPSRQLFDHRKDDPVRFFVLARPQQGRPIPTPKSSGDYVSSSSTSSYAASQASSAFTLSSTTDGSSASSALFDRPGKPSEESSTKFFSDKVKRLYRDIVHLETKVQQEDNEDTENTSRIMLKPKEAEDEEEAQEKEMERWRQQIDDHKSLAENIHNLLEISLGPAVPASLRTIPIKYNIIVRLWTHGFFKLLESLRRASFTSPSAFTSKLALEHLQDYIYYAYTFYAGLLEEPMLSSFKAGWLEALGDLARYRMIVASHVKGHDQTGPALTQRNLSEAVAMDTTTTNLDNLKLPTTDAKSLSDEPAARIDDSPSPSVGLAAARLLNLEPERETWRAIARDWYGAGLADQPGTGKLHHHLGLLSREVEEEELKGIYHYVKSMTTLHPFMTSRESVLPMWSPAAQLRRSHPDARVPDLFVLLHGMLFTNIQLDDFTPTLARFIERLDIEGAEERDWVMMGVINIGSILEYGKPSGVLKRAGGMGSREPGSAAAAAMKVLAKRDLGERMDVDDDPNTQPSPAMSEAEPDSPVLPASFTLACHLTFTMLSHVLRRPTRKPSPFARSTLNPYLTVILTFLSTVLRQPQTLNILERSIPWEDLATFFRIIPRSVMASQGLGPSSQPSSRDSERWVMLTTGCAPPLSEDWCLRGMEWVGRKVYERGFWKSGDERRMEIEYLLKSESDPNEMTDGHIEDDDGDDNNSKRNSESGELAKRWVRIARCAVGVASVVDGFTWVEGTREWIVEGRLAEKVATWKEQDRVEREEEERRRMGTRWADDSMEVDDDNLEDSMSEDSDDEGDSEEVKILKARRRHLRSLVQSANDSPVPIPPTLRRPRSSRKEADTRPSLPIKAGYTVLVVDTNILLSSLPLFASVVESLRWTVVVPLPVIMELDGLSSNLSQLGEAAQSAMAYMSSHIRSHATSLKVQTSKGNYLTTLSVRTEEVDFTSGNAERNMDDLILKAAIWHDEHWVDRSAMLKTDITDVQSPVKVVLLSLDRNLRLKSRSRQLPAASEKDLAAILSTGT